MGLYGSHYDYVIHVALITNSHVSSSSERILDTRERNGGRWIGKQLQPERTRFNDHGGLV